ncbi:glycosyltransferase [Helicobacter salomonis]|uniref:glycosyltransferase n=1 Tax=Helicobacter salomonis TaxID=56878 RepID=UPI001F449CF8|nr:glycosyltransferase [Helicobacter salomonis]
MEFECLDARFSTTRMLYKKPPSLEQNQYFTRYITYPLSGTDIQGGLRVAGYFKQSHPQQPLVSVILATLNSQECLEATLQSIFNQSYDNLECLVIDGGSSDGTLEILKHLSDRIDYFISQKDRGIAEAFNKGVRLSFGDYMNFQGDGDGFVAPNALQEVMAGVRGGGEHSLVHGWCV